MANQRNGISYVSDTWNPTRGCGHVSEGCRHCWAERMAARQRWGLYAGLVLPGEARWNGRADFAVDQLDVPLHWRKPRTIAVSLMGDLFHPDISHEQRAAIYGVMAACAHHTFLVLTKRPEIRLEFYDWIDDSTDRAIRFGNEATRHRFYERFALARDARLDWPLANVWEGITAEDQRTLLHRWPILWQTPAAHRWISCEPLLEAVSIDVEHHRGAGRPDWLVAGGESGPQARPTNLAWLRALKDQCREFRIPFHLKQLGAWPVTQSNGRDQKARAYPISDRKGAIVGEWPPDLRIQEGPSWQMQPRP